MYKQLNIAHVEALGSAGSWNSFAKLLKQQAGMSSAYIDKVKLSWILEDVEPSPSSLGVLFACSTKETMSNTEAENDGTVISARAGLATAGTVTLDIRRRITDNDFDENSGENALMLHCKPTNATESLSVTLIIETWGRWHTTEAI